ncbi:hypothetical protein FRB96_009107 [Tulasnella sp. 330]|nr:hypothetical protein FRB96_009107 [Tulasnella sp. 330]KAG8879822.1 hypothetical protein FRB97_001353 [Tulasnella sp. 331]KAG8885831.1 hypothetical protein FRB98_001612 [Tulasnella sp. 332]
MIGELARRSQQTFRQLLSKQRDQKHQTKAALLCSLPIEVLLMIVASLAGLHSRDHDPRAAVERPGLLALLRTCREMRHVVEPFLYKDIVITWNWGWRLQRLLRTLGDRRDLAKRTTTFHGLLCPSNYNDLKDSKYKWAGDQRRKKLEAMLVRALDNMTNLHSFQLRDLYFGPATPPWSAPLSLISQLRRAPLTSLSVDAPRVWCETGVTTPGHLRLQTICTAELFSLIRRQPGLEYLRLPAGFGEMVEGQLLATDVPKLTSLTAGVADARLVVPGRPITSLNLLDLPSRHFSDAWNDMSRSTAPLTEVTLTSSSGSARLASNMEAIGVHIDDIKSLTILGIREEHYEAVGLTSSFNFLGGLSLTQVAYSI